MADCCEEDRRSPLELIPAGLDTIPRQAAGFPEVRLALLEAVAHHPDLGTLRPSGDDFGLMWLEMWAYLSDVLAFYDERIANETYLRTAVRGPSLRRITGLLGHKPLTGVAGSATVALLAEGNVPVTIPKGTRVRSRSFEGSGPQVFEVATETAIHRLSNSWTVAPFTRRPTIDVPQGNETSGGGKGGAAEAGDPSIDALLFVPRGFGLAAEDLVLIDSRDPGTPLGPMVTRVMSAETFAGKDGASYMRAVFDPAVTIPADFDLTQLRVRKPVRTVSATVNTPRKQDDGKTTYPAIEPVSSPANGLRVFLDGAPTGFARNAPVIIARDLSTAEPDYAAATVHAVGAATVRVDSIPPQSVPGSSVEVPSPSVPATELILAASAPYTLGTAQDRLSFHHGFVDGGQATNVAPTTIAGSVLAEAEGVPLKGIVAPPPLAEAAAAALGGSLGGVLEQRFLLCDAASGGALVDGRLTFERNGRAAFVALDAAQLPAEIRLPLTIYGNVVDVTRGESVTGEVLGNGNAQIAGQRFKLKKKPLTYLQTASDDNTTGVQSTLSLYVSGLMWKEVKSFYGCGPQDKVFVTHHDDEGNTFIIGGDGVRGARFATGVKNVVANYRHGAGHAAPPAGAINQLGGSLKGLRGVASPVDAVPGKDGELAEETRQNAPKTALLLGRAVSAADYQAIAAAARGVSRASAEWVWLDGQLQAGIAVRFIGDTTPGLLLDELRLVGDPTVPIEVVAATPLAATVALTVEVDPRYVPAAVAEAVKARLLDPITGPLAVRNTPIGGPFVPGTIFAAAASVEGVVGVSGLTVTLPPGAPAIPATRPTCLPAGSYIDVSAGGAVTVTGVAPAGTLPPPPRTGEAAP